MDTDNALIILLLKRLYETERKLEERNFAHGNSFEEWLRYNGFTKAKEN